MRTSSKMGWSNPKVRSHRWLGLCACLALLGPTSAVTAQEALEETSPPAVTTTDGGGWNFWFNTLEEYRLRVATDPTAPTLSAIERPASNQVTGQTDHDVRLFFDGSMNDGTDALSAHLAFNMWTDVDGTTPEDDDVSGLGTMYDGASAPLWFDVYSLYGKYATGGFLKSLKVGRQSTNYGRMTTFDGLSVDLEAVDKMLDFFVFGGRTVHFFEADAGLFEDFLGSVGTTIRPSKTVKVELDYRFVQEDMTVNSALAEGDTVRDSLTEHAYGAKVWYRPADWFSAKLKFHGITDKIANIGLLADFNWSSLGFGVTAKVDAQPSTLRELNETDDRYFAILGESLAHVKANLQVWKTFETDFGNFGLHAGWKERVLLKDAVVGSAFNHNMGIFYGLVQVSDIGTKSPFASVMLAQALNHTETQFFDAGVLTVGGSIGWEADSARGEIGSFYQQYKYDYYKDVQERTDVRTLFAAAQYEPLDWLALRARYEYEQFDRDVHTFTFTLTQNL